MFNGSAFDRHEIPDFATTSVLTTINAARGDMWGNVWLAGTVIETDQSLYIFLRYNLDTGEITRFDKTSCPIIEFITDIRSDPMGNVWLGSDAAVAEFNGQGFITYPAPVSITSLEIAPDQTVFCGTSGAGLWMMKDGAWQRFTNLTQPTRTTGYEFAMGMADGRATLAFDLTFGLKGYEVLGEDRSYVVGADDGSLPLWIRGLTPGKEGLWAWGSSEGVYHQTAHGWEDVSPASTDGTTLISVEESPDGTPYLLSELSLWEYDGSSWSTVSVPKPGMMYTDMWFDADGRMYLLDFWKGIAIRDLDGDWTQVDISKSLSAQPETMILSEAGVPYVAGQQPDLGGFLTLIDNATTAVIYWLADRGYPTLEVYDISMDLAGRLWLITRAQDRSSRIIVFDPQDESFTDLPWTSGIMPYPSIANTALSYQRDSMPRMGVLWWTSSNGISRVNLAPRTELLLDKAAYSAGEAMRVDAYFANQAGSIPVDWYAAVEDEAGNLFYWPTYSSEKAPASEGLLVPTDTAFILHLDDIVIPGDVPPGHYRWKTGFTRAGQEMWLGLGFTATGEFDITAKP